MVVLESLSPTTPERLAPSAPLLSARAAAPGLFPSPGRARAGTTGSPRAVSSGSTTTMRSAGGVTRDTGEEELARLSKNELLEILQAEWTKHDQNIGTIADLTSERDVLQTSYDRLAAVIQHHVQTEEEHEKETSRLEDDLANKLAVAHKLQARVSELEADKREREKRYQEQTLSFEAERQALYDDEQHLKSRLLTASRRQVSSSGSTSPPTITVPLAAPDTGAEAPVDPELAKDVLRLAHELRGELETSANLRRDLEMLEVGYKSLQGALERKSEEMDDLKKLNLGLQEEIESFSLLLVERTISGHRPELFSRSYKTSSDESPLPGSLSGLRPSSPDFEASSPSESSEGRSLRSVDEEPELDPALYFDHEDGSGSTEDEVDEALDPEFRSDTAGKELSLGDSSPARGGKRKGAARRARVEKMLDEAGIVRDKMPRGESLGDWAVTGSGLDLAAELGRAEESVEEGGLRKLSKGDDGEAIRAELKALKEANRALTLYCSKILDRIMSIDGFEAVLSADHGNSLQATIRRARSSHQLANKKSSRPSLQELSQTMASSSVPENEREISTLPPPSSLAPAGRSAASMSPPPHAAIPVPTPVPSKRPVSPVKVRTEPPTPQATKPQRKGRSGSIDWRSGFGFFSSSSSSSTPTTSPSTPSSATFASHPQTQTPPLTTTMKLRPLSLSASIGVGPSPQRFLPRQPSGVSSSVSSPGLGLHHQQPQSLVSSPGGGAGTRPRGMSEARKVSLREEVEDPEDRLQRERVALLRQQLELEAEEESQQQSIKQQAHVANVSAQHLDSLSGSSPSSSSRQEPASHGGGGHHSRSNSRSTSLSFSSVGGANGRPAPIDSLMDHFGASSPDRHLIASPRYPGTTAGQQYPQNQHVGYFPPHGFTLPTRGDVTDEMVASHLSTLDSAERLRASEIASGRGGGFSVPTRRASINASRMLGRQLRERERMGPADVPQSPEEIAWLEGGRSGSGAAWGMSSGGTGSTGAGREAGETSETLFRFEDY